jgi:hypothetical protein
MFFQTELVSLVHLEKKKKFLAKWQFDRTAKHQLGGTFLGPILQKQDPKMFYQFGVLPFHQFDILPNDIFPICGWSKVCQGVEEIIIIRRN